MFFRKRWLSLCRAGFTLEKEVYVKKISKKWSVRPVINSIINHAVLNVRECYATVICYMWEDCTHGSIWTPTFMVIFVFLITDDIYSKGTKIINWKGKKLAIAVNNLLVFFHIGTHSIYMQTRVPVSNIASYFAPFSSFLLCWACLKVTELWMPYWQRPVTSSGWRKCKCETTGNIRAFGTLGTIKRIRRTTTFLHRNTHSHTWKRMTSCRVSATWPEVFHENYSRRQRRRKTKSSSFNEVHSDGG